MIVWGIVFFVLAVIAAVIGFGSGVAAMLAGIAQAAFFIFLVFFVVCMILGMSEAADDDDDFFRY